MFRILATFLLVLATSSLVHGQSILIQAQGADEKSFQYFLKNNPGMQSYADFVEDSIKRNPKQESHFFSLSESYQEKTELILQYLSESEKEAPWTPLTTQFIYDLSEKLLQQKINPTEKVSTNYYLCKSAALLKKSVTSSTCPGKNISLRLLSSQFPNYDRVLIESTSHTLQGSVFLNPQISYHWTLLSNALPPFHFYGPWEELLLQKAPLNFLAQGNCLEPQYPEFSFELSQRAVIFYSEACQKAVRKDLEAKLEGRSQRALLLTTGALAIGGLLYLLRDKNLIIQGPSF